jgi:putative PIN family toxin of toxin-antitoxin system
MNSGIKVVLDTNVLVSALWTDSGKPATIIKLMPKIIIPCFNDAIFSEYNDVLNRPKFNFSDYNKKLLFSKIREYGEFNSPSKSVFPMRDESDRIFYDTAKASGAILITGNASDYPAEPFIMKPSDFLESFALHR